MKSPEGIDPKRAHYEEKLWAKAEELSRLRVKLVEESDSAYKKVESGNVDAIGLEAKTQISELQKRYFDLQSEIEAITKQEMELQNALEQINSGLIDESFLETLIGKEEKVRLSKRKQKIMDERLRTGVDPRTGELVSDPIGLKVDTYVVKNYGPGSNRITTGHHSKGITGNLGSGSGREKELEREFYTATQDTHGGKANHGKSGSWYVNKSGKNVRKR